MCARWVCISVCVYLSMRGGVRVASPLIAGGFAGACMLGRWILRCSLVPLHQLAQQRVHLVAAAEREVAAARREAADEAKRQREEATSAAEAQVMCARAWHGCMHLVCSLGLVNTKVWVCGYACVWGGGGHPVRAGGWVC
jgi:hypothetical protein